MVSIEYCECLIFKMDYALLVGYLSPKNSNNQQSLQAENIHCPDPNDFQILPPHTILYNLEIFLRM